MDNRLYPQGRGGIHGKYVDGVLYFYNAAGAVVYSIDPENRTLNIPSGATLSNAGTSSLSGTQSFDDVSVAQTLTDPSAATRIVRSELTLTSASTAVAALGTNSAAAVRGAVTVTSGKQLTSGFAYGVQGKLVLDGATVAIGSNHAAGVYAQLSGSGATITSGHVAVLVVSGQSLPASANVNMIYCESGGNAINAVIQSLVKATYFLDIEDFESAGVCAATGQPADVASSNKGWIKVKVAGAVRYIPLAETVS